MHFLTRTFGPKQEFNLTSLLYSKDQHINPKSKLTGGHRAESCCDANVFLRHGVDSERECSRYSIQGEQIINGVSDLMVNTTCARRVQVTKTKIEYQALLLHLFSRKGEKDGDAQNGTTAIRTSGKRRLPHHPIVSKNSICWIE